MILSVMYSVGTVAQHNKCCVLQRPITPVSCHLYKSRSLRPFLKFKVFHDSIVRCVTIGCYKRTSEV